MERLQELLPDYEITALIGRGGMGAVYKGVQSTLGRTVAIKLLPESLQEDAGDAGYVERFKLEARAMAGLDHPAIISVHDFGQTSEGHLYFVMEFIDGMDLQQYLNASGGKLEADAAVAIISHVLDALDYAHKKGIVHRDIKPANVLINSEGRVKIADFGLAKQIGAEGVGLTMSNMAMGTPDFIAPEAMLDSASSDGRADLYAVGVMLYQMLTGKLPRGMFKLPSEEDASFDPRFDDIIASALEPNPEFRFSAAKDFRKKLDELRSQPVSRVEGRSTIERRGAKTQDVAPAVRGGLPPRPAARKSGGGVLWAMAAVALLGVGGWLIWGGKKGDGPEPTEVPPADFWNVPSSAVTSEKGEPGQKDAAPRTQQADATWPNDDHYRSAGRFRAWSSIPNDPQIDIGALAKLTSVKQVEVHRVGWVVLQDDGTLKANSNGAHAQRSVARIERGYNERFATIDIDGTLMLWPILKAHEKMADGMGPVVSAFHCDDFVAAVTRDGKLEVRGKAFDDPSAENKGRWIDHPKLDPDDKVVGLAACDECLAVRLSTGDIRMWRPERRQFSPPNGFFEGKLNAYAVNRASLFASIGPGNTVKSLITRNDPPTHGVELGFTGIETFEYTQLGMAGITSDQRLLIHSSLSNSFPDLIEVAKRVNDPQPDLISIFAAPEFGARLLWFEPEEPSIPEVAAPAKETSASQSTAAGQPAPKPAPSAWIDLLPEIASNNQLKTRGDWTTSPSKIATKFPSFEAAILAPADQKAPCKVRVTCTSRVSKRIYFHLPTPTGSTDFSIHHVSNNMGLGNPSPERMKPLSFDIDDDRPHLFEFHILDDRFLVWRDTELIYERPVASWSDYDTSSELVEGRRIGFGVHQGVVEFTSYQVQPMDDSSTARPKVDVGKIPELAPRIVNYQKARATQLADLTGKYQKALAAAKTEASEVGNAAHVRSIDLAIGRAAANAEEIEKLPTTKLVAILPALPQLDASTPASLQRLRKIFDEETAKIEADLLGKLDQSLEVLQTSMLETGELDAVDALRAYRKSVSSLSLAASRAPAKPEMTPRLPVATKDEPFVNSLGMKFVPIPGDSVLMCIHETRRQDYQVYADTVPGVDETWKRPMYDGELVKQTPSHPAIHVSWDDATAFCQWLSMKEGKTYRLPTDHEFELAIVLNVDTPEILSNRELKDAINSTTPWAVFPRGPDGKFVLDKGLPERFGNYAGTADGYEWTAPVMSFPPNHLGIYDLGGNVWEWMSNPHKAGSSQKVMRGAGFGTKPFALTIFSTSRIEASVDFREPPQGDKWQRIVGFRVVLEPATLQSSGTRSLLTKPASAPNIAATKDDPLENSLGMRFVPVPIAGGPSDGETVFFSVWETRAQDYLAFTAETGRAWTGPDFDHDDDHPVVNVTWDDAVAFCRWLTEREGKAGGLPDGWEFRLPSDHEWSCAAGLAESASATPAEKSAAHVGIYPWGSGPPQPKDFANYQGVDFDSFLNTAPVGQFASNGYGLFDLWGNVAEWCDDWKDQLNKGPHVVRGCGWNHYGPYRTSAYRGPWDGSLPKEGKTHGIGFRVVLSPP